ncbi:MAG: alpha/beta hydrolase [Cytophagales bacterium]|nr:MAG: alpha/beta hydrolase [Cytophagales bacterium]
MPHITINNVQIYYEEYGSGAETIVFSHGLLWSGKMFLNQVEALKNRYRCIIYDHRGQGQSQKTTEGLDMDTLTEDAVALIKALNAAPCHFAGLSMGGFVAMRLGARHPELLRSVILLETSADAEPTENVPRYTTLNNVVRWLGTWAVAKPVMKIMFGQKILQDSTRKELVKKWKKELINNPSTITRAVKGVIERKPIFDELKNIQLPTLIIVGDQDVATVPAKSERIKSQIPQAQLVIIEGAGHSSSIEEPEQVNKAIESFLNQHS